MHPLAATSYMYRSGRPVQPKKNTPQYIPTFFIGKLTKPGIFLLPPKVVWDLLKATCEETGRNSFKKIVSINGREGNPNLLQYFAQTQLHNRRNYAVYFFTPGRDLAYTAKVNQLRNSDVAGDSHAGENETSILLYLRPKLVKMDNDRKESGEDLKGC